MLSRCLILLLSLLYPLISIAMPEPALLSVWANEAIVATYTYNYKDFLLRQREIAKYFTSSAWMTYSVALQQSKLPESVQENKYAVNSVATKPPVLQATGSNQWQAKMPLLVVYENPQYEQKQNIEVTISFKAVPAGQGVRGLAITNFNAVTISEPCRCMH